MPKPKKQAIIIKSITTGEPIMICEVVELSATEYVIARNECAKNLEKLKALKREQRARIGQTLKEHETEILRLKGELDQYGLERN